MILDFFSDSSYQENNSKKTRNQQIIGHTDQVVTRFINF